MQKKKKHNKRIHLNIGKKQNKTKNNNKQREIKSKMCNRIKCAHQIRCAKQYTVDLRNSNMNRDVQEGCANRLYRVYTCSSNTDDGNSECFTVNK